MPGMAVKAVTKAVTIPASGSVSLATILNRPGTTWIYALALRAARANADDISWKDEGGETGGYIGPGEAVSHDFGEGQAMIQNFTLYGDANDVVYLTAYLNRHYFEPNE